jgi:hypothetical protein
MGGSAGASPPAVFKGRARIASGRLASTDAAGEISAGLRKAIIQWRKKVTFAATPAKLIGAERPRPNSRPTSLASASADNLVLRADAARERLADGAGALRRPFSIL